MGRPIERMVEAHEGKHKDLVKFITHQTCISPMQIRKLVRVLELKTIVIDRFSEEPQPSILAEALTAPDPVALVIQAIEEEWTAKQGKALYAAEMKRCGRYLAPL